MEFWKIIAKLPVVQRRDKPEGGYFMDRSRRDRGKEKSSEKCKSKNRQKLVTDSFGCTWEMPGLSAQKDDG